MNHQERQLAMFKDKQAGAHRLWDRTYENYKNGQATKEDLVVAMEICNAMDKACLNIILKTTIHTPI